MRETYSDDGFICPYCESVYTEPEGLHYTDDRDPEVKCESCEETYFVCTHISIAWETFKDVDEL